MKTYSVTFCRNPVIVLILVVMPLLVVAVFLFGLFSLKNLPDWLVLVASFAMIGVSLGVVLLTIKRWGSIPAEVVMDDGGITIRLLRYSPFYPRKEYKASWDGLENVSSNFDPQHDKRFYLLRFRDPATTVSLDPGDITNADAETPFGEALQGYVTRYNAAHEAQPDRLIRHRGFYDTWWAKGLTIIAYLSIAGVLIAYFIDGSAVGIWRVIQVLSFSILWLGAYHVNRRKKA